MGINLLVIRDLGDISGPDIIDTMITSEEVALSRGTQFLDANHKNRLLVSTNGPLRQWIAPGSLVEVIDSEQAAYRALLTGIGLNITKSGDSFTADCSLSLEKIDQ